MLSNINENTTDGQYTSDISVTQSKFVIKKNKGIIDFCSEAFKNASIMESPIYQQQMIFLYRILVIYLFSQLTIKEITINLLYVHRKSSFRNRILIYLANSSIH